MNFTIRDLHNLPGTNLIALAQFNLTIHFDDTGRDQGTARTAAIGESGVFEQVIQFDKVLRQGVFDFFHWGASLLPV